MMMIGNVWTDVSLATDCDLNQGEFYFLISCALPSLPLASVVTVKNTF
jgi:hypothetical protein